MSRLLACVLLAGTAPLSAASAAPVPPAPTAPALDPARLALAGKAVDHVWPLGTYQRMMSTTFDQMMDGMMASMLDMPVDQMVGSLLPPGAEGEQTRKSLGGSTMREIAAKTDPHFEERMRITNRVMMTEMGTLMSALEPAMREGLTRAYAKKFTAGQLSDLNAFFATPTGRVYAAESMLLFTDPEVMKLMTAATPEMLKALPAMFKKVEAATAHLPPPPRREEEKTGEEKGLEDGTR